MSQNVSLEAITSAVLALINAQTKAECLRIIKSQHHLLLLDAADQLLADWLEASQGHSEHIRILQERRSLLARCRREGIEAAFADRVRPAMAEVPPDLIARLLAVESEEEFTQLLTEHPELLPVVAMMMPEAGQQENSLDSFEELADTLWAFVRAGKKSKAYLAQHPELLTDEAFALLALLIEGEENEEVRHILRLHRDLLDEVRQKGLDEAFAELTSRSSSSENRLMPLLDALIACDNPTAVYELVAQQPELLSDEMDAFLQETIAAAEAHGSDEGKIYAQQIAARHQTLRQLRSKPAG